MTHKIDFSLVSSEEVEIALSQRLESIRLNRNLTQANLAKQAGISRSTVTRLAQARNGISLDSFIRIMLALNLHDHLQALLPDPGISPLEQLERGGEKRHRARGKQKVTKKWTWGDDGEKE